MGANFINTQFNLWYYGFPAPAIEAILSLSQNYPWVSTTWVSPRKTKLGDFRPAGAEQKFPVITLNKNLETYVALLVWVHEFAHHINWVENKNRVEAHGPEWKYHFKRIYHDYFQGVFPQEWNKPLAQYFRNPSAASFSHPALQPFIMPEDKLGANELRLSKIPDGSRFIFKEREFIREKALRSFVLCQEKESGKKYRIRANCPVRLKSA
ncbi:MAG: SprT-like domain-containing protein [Luteibaculum sp.]